MQYGICRCEVVGFIGCFTVRSMCQRLIELFQILKKHSFDSVFILASCMIFLTPVLEYDTVAQIALYLDLRRTTKNSRLSNPCDSSCEKIIDKCEFWIFPKSSLITQWFSLTVRVAARQCKTASNLNARGIFYLLFELQECHFPPPHSHSQILPILKMIKCIPFSVEVRSCFCVCVGMG